MISVHTFLQRERQRLDAWLSGPAESLASVETARTIGNCVDRERLGRRLPDGWRVDCEIVQFPGESLAEVVRLTGPEAYRITLKPIELCAPTDRIEIYTRASPSTSRQHRRTVDSLSDSLIYAMGIATSRHGRDLTSANGSTETAGGRQ